MATSLGGFGFRLAATGFRGYRRLVLPRLYSRAHGIGLGLALLVSGWSLASATEVAPVLDYQIWEDVSGDTGYPEIEQIFATGAFVDAAEFESVEAAGVYWLRLARIESEAVAPSSELVLRGKGIEVAELFDERRKSGERGEWVTGQYLSRPSLAVANLRNRLPLPAVLPEAEAIYLRWQGAQPSDDALKIAPAAGVRPRPASDIYTKGIFRGAMLGIGIYYLFLFFRLGVGIYGWLALYVLALAGYTIVQEGDVRFFGPSPVGWKSYWILIHGLLVLNMVGGVQFARSFLNLPAKFPRWNRVLLAVHGVNFISLLWLGIILVRGNNPYEIENTHTYLMFAVMLLLIGLTVACVMRGQRSAIYYALSYGVLCLGVWTDVTLNYWGYFEADSGTLWATIRAMLTPHSYYFGLLGEVFLMAFAVASSIAEIQRSRDKATALAIDSALETANLKESYNQDLARELAERTTDVREKNVQLEERDILKSRFFANLSHEFRTPLSLIRGPAEDLARGEHGELDATGRRKVNTLLGQSAQLEGLIDQLLELSRLDAGKLKLRAGARDICVFTKTAVRSFSSLAEKRGVRLEFESDLPEFELWFDEEMLRKVINNLVSNALKFTPSGGEVRVRLADTPGELVNVAVSDTGRGIPSELVEHVFERFFQVENDSMQHQQGSGIGLALAKELVELHGGLIGAKSELGEGTEITFSLPKGRAHLGDDEIIETVLDTVALEDQAMVADADVPAKPVAVGRVDRPTVLIVEDFEEMREYIRERLASRMNVLEAADGEEALMIARRESPDLILSDVMMPRRDGISMLAEIRADPGLKNIPVILLTARGDEEDRLRGLAARADDYLTKPFNARELLLRVENLLKARAELVADYRKGDQPVVVADLEVSSVDREFLDELDQVVSENYEAAEFQLDALARRLRTSDATLRRRLKSLLQITPAQYLRTFRLQKAQQLIAGRGFKTVGEVANAAGFSSPGYFARLYQKEFGLNAASQLRKGMG